MINHCSNCGKEMEEYEYRNNDKCIFCIEREGKYERMGINKTNGESVVGDSTTNR